jgi:hypothetical protein
MYYLKHNTASIESIEEIEYNDDVYDIEVLDNHNYFANGHLVHNCNKLVLEGVFGPAHRVASTKKLMDEGKLANLKIKAIVLKYSDQIRKDAKHFDYQREMDFLVTNIARNQFITNLTVSCTGNTLLLFQYVEKHGSILYDMINNKVSDRKVFFIHGGVDANDREEVRKILSEQKDDIIITFNNNKIEIPSYYTVPLSNGSFKLAKDITIEDDIDDKWINSNLKNQKL